MKLWLVSNIRLDPQRGWKASGLQNLRTAIALADGGHEVSLLCDQLGKNAQSWCAEQLGRTMPSGLELIHAKARGKPGEKRSAFNTSWRRFYQLSRIVASRGFPDAIMTRSPRIVCQLKATPLLPRGIRVIHELQYPEWSFLWRNWRRSNPSAGLRESVQKFSQLRAADEVGYRRADGVLYAARAHERLLQHAGYVGPREWLRSATVPAPESTPNPRIEFDCGYVGTLSPENGLGCLLQALAQIPDKCLLIVGAGPTWYADQLRQQVEELGLTSRVKFAGRQAPSEVHDWMRRCRLGIVPISARFGIEKRAFASPLKLVEWMAAGRPVIASQVPSVVQHEQDGDPITLFRADDPGALAHAVTVLLEDKNRSLRIAERGRERVRLRTFESRARQIARFIEELS